MSVHAQSTKRTDSTVRRSHVPRLSIRVEMQLWRRGGRGTVEVRGRSFSSVSSRHSADRSATESYGSERRRGAGPVVGEFISVLLSSACGPSMFVCPEKMRRGMEEERRLAWRELEASRQQLLREKRRVDSKHSRSLGKNSPLACALSALSR